VTESLTRTEAGVVSVRAADGVAVVTIDNPPVNALSDGTLAGLEAVGERLAADDAVRAIVLTGTGSKAFAAGADIEEFNESLADVAWLERHTALTRRVLSLWETLAKPVVAAVQASAVGGGLELALVCDLIVADPSARFGFPEVTLGLIPGAGGTQRLPRAVPQAIARELVMLGSLVDAEKAYRVGLVNRVSELGQAVAEAEALAVRLAALPAVAIRSAKRALQGAGLPLESGLDVERSLFHHVCASADAQEGVSAFVERRPPSFGHR